MAQAFRMLEDVAIADAAFEAVGDTLEEVFNAATQATIELLADPTTVSPDWRREVDLSEEDVDSLLFEWLSNLVYLKDAQSVVFREGPLTLHHDALKNRWLLHGTLIGASINPLQQSLRSDIKAVTKHQYFLGQVKGQWVARVVLDL